MTDIKKVLKEVLTFVEAINLSSAEVNISEFTVNHIIS